MAVVPPPPGPTIARDASSFSRSVYMGQDAGSNVFCVWNSGTGTLNYAISPDSASSAWLAVAPASGASTGEHDRIQINYTTAGLPVDSYTGLISIVSADATNSPQTVKVIMAVLPPLPGPTIAYSPSSFSRGVYLNANASSNIFYIWNAGTGTFTYALSADSIWLLTDPTGGTVTNKGDGTQPSGNGGIPNRIQINYSTASLGVGTYTGLITIASADVTNSPQIVKVTLTVAALRPPVITHIGMSSPQATTIQWQSETNFSYRILKSDSLAGSFDLVTNAVLATPPINTYDDTSLGGASFYRVEVEQ